MLADRRASNRIDVTKGMTARRSMARMPESDGCTRRAYPSRSDGEGDRSPTASGGGAKHCMKATANAMATARRFRRNLSLPEQLLWRLLRTQRGQCRFRPNLLRASNEKRSKWERYWRDLVVIELGTENILHSRIWRNTRSACPLRGRWHYARLPPLG
jgi:hypothetical protein